MLTKIALLGGASVVILMIGRVGAVLESSVCAKPGCTDHRECRRRQAEFGAKRS